MTGAMGRDFSRALSVDFHPIYVATNNLFSQSVIDSIINVLAVPNSHKAIIAYRTSVTR